MDKSTRKVESKDLPDTPQDIDLHMILKVNFRKKAGWLGKLWHRGASKGPENEYLDNLVHKNQL